MGTPLSEVYDAFFIKSSLDYTAKEDQVFQFFKTGVSKSRKIVPHDLAFTIYVDDDFDGEFVELLDQDEIELIALNMLLEERRKKLSELDYEKQHIGTKDFNRLPEKKEDYKISSLSFNTLKDEIKEFEQTFKSYKN